jgi:hypothetical protein
MRRGWRSCRLAWSYHGQDRFWELTGDWWYRKNVSVPAAKERKRARREINSLFPCGAGYGILYGVKVTYSAHTETYLSGAGGYYPGAKGYWKVGLQNIWSDKTPSRLGRLIARVLFSIEWHDRYIK